MPKEFVNCHPWQRETSYFQWLIKDLHVHTPAYKVQLNVELPRSVTGQIDGQAVYKLATFEQEAYWESKKRKKASEWVAYQRYPAARTHIIFVTHTHNYIQLYFWNHMVTTTNHIYNENISENLWAWTGWNWKYENY